MRHQGLIMALKLRAPGYYGRIIFCRKTGEFFVKGTAIRAKAEDVYQALAHYGNVVKFDGDLPYLESNEKERA